MRVGLLVGGRAVARGLARVGLELLQRFNGAVEEAQVVAVDERHGDARLAAEARQRLDPRRVVDGHVRRDRLRELEDLEQVGGPAREDGDCPRALRVEPVGRQRVAHALDVLAHGDARIMLEVGLVGHARGGVQCGRQLGLARGRRGEFGGLEVEVQAEHASALRPESRQPPQARDIDVVDEHAGDVPHARDG